MSDRRWQIDRAYERRSDEIGKAYERGDLTDAEYNEALGELERDMRDEERAAYEQDMEDVRESWGW